MITKEMCIKLGEQSANPCGGCIFKDTHDCPAVTDNKELAR